MTSILTSLGLQEAAIISAIMLSAWAIVERVRLRRRIERLLKRLNA